MTILQMMARGLHPGVRARYVTILEGLEGTKKSTLVETLGAPWYVIFDMSMDSKEAHMLIQGCWVSELCELSAVNRSQEARVKSFLSQTSDDYVPKYSNHRVSRPRRTVFIGTTNDQAQYLVGQTGNTRFLPVKTGVIDIEALATNREQLFAEALTVYHARQHDWWEPPPGLEDILREEREDRRESSSWEEPVRTWLNGDKIAAEWVSLGEVMAGALNIKKEDWVRHQKAVGHVMRTLGWTYGRVPRTTGTRGRAWHRPAPTLGGPTIPTIEP